MALDYLTILGKHHFFGLVIGIHTHHNTSVVTSVDVECVFSKGCIFLSHLCSCLSIQSMHTLMCVGEWSKLGYMKDKDIRAVTTLPEVEGKEEVPQENWDVIMSE